MYGDKITDSMDKAMNETERRRAIQMAYNEKHGITPQTIRKKVRDVIEATKVAEQKADYLTGVRRRQDVEERSSVTDSAAGSGDEGSGEEPAVRTCRRACGMRCLS